MKKDNKKDPKKLNRRARLVELIREDKKTFAVYVVLRLIVIAVAVLQFFNGNYANAALCLFTLVLFLLPAFVESNFGVRVPSTLEIIVLLFIFAALRQAVDKAIEELRSEGTLSELSNKYFGADISSK